MPGNALWNMTKYVVQTDVQVKKISGAGHLNICNDTGPNYC